MARRLIRATWQRVYNGLPPGVMLCHRTTVGGWHLSAELVLTGGGCLRLQVNGQPYGPVLTSTSFAEGRRRYRAMLRRVGCLRQMTLALDAEPAADG